MDRQKLTPGIPLFARFGGLVCLLAVLAGPAGILPALLAAGAALEGSHTVHLSRVEGTCHLVLSHERGTTGCSGYDARHNPGSGIHRHGIVARALCLLAEPAGVEPDHVADFSIGPAGEKLSSSVLRPAKFGQSSIVLLQQFVARVPTSDFVKSVLLLNCGPPEGAFFVRSLRSTVLLV